LICDKFTVSVISFTQSSLSHNVHLVSYDPTYGNNLLLRVHHFQSDPQLAREVQLKEAR